MKLIYTRVYLLILHFYILWWESEEANKTLIWFKNKNEENNQSKIL